MDSSVLYVRRSGTIGRTPFEAHLWEAHFHAPDAVHDIVPIPGSKWIVVGSSCNPKTRDITTLDIHYDAAASHEMVSPDEFFPLKDADSLARDLNLRHTKSIRLALRRATDTSIHDSVRDKEGRAEAYLALAKMMRANSEKTEYEACSATHIVGLVRSPRDVVAV